VGQSYKFIDNAEQLGVNLAQVDYVVLSHGHYDHTGGLPAFLKLNTKAKILMHPNGLKERFSRSANMIKSNGIPWRNDWKSFEDRIQFIDKTIELFKGFWVVADLDGEIKYSSLDQRLVYKDGENLMKDHFEDELIVVAQEKDQTILLTGCAHNGIVNILKCVKHQLGINSYQFVGGGLHLSGQSADKISEILNGLKDYSVDHWGLNHCTGETAIDLFYQAYPEKVNYFRGGDVW
jgi:7,8-dihydropterin-6-yl-methyl-4-(beta-D-ribofuranosyl)aminobenzene 5'-phosphate synthase